MSGELASKAGLLQICMSCQNVTGWKKNFCGGKKKEFNLLNLEVRGEPYDD